MHLPLFTHTHKHILFYHSQNQNREQGEMEKGNRFINSVTGEIYNFNHLNSILSSILKLKTTIDNLFVLGKHIEQGVVNNEELSIPEQINYLKFCKDITKTLLKEFELFVSFDIRHSLSKYFGEIPFEIESQAIWLSDLLYSFSNSNESANYSKYDALLTKKEVKTLLLNEFYTWLVKSDNIAQHGISVVEKTVETMSITNKIVNPIQFWEIYYQTVDLIYQALMVYFEKYHLLLNYIGKIDDEDLVKDLNFEWEEEVSLAINSNSEEDELIFPFEEEQTPVEEHIDSTNVDAIVQMLVQDKKQSTETEEFFEYQKKLLPVLKWYKDNAVIIEEIQKEKSLGYPNKKRKIN